MTVYSYAQLESLWEQAGGSTAMAPVMAAIATAESGGNSNAYNPSGATGLWQILGAVDPADQSRLYDPHVNAHEALLKYQTQGLSAWVTYTSGAYRQYLQGNVPPQAAGGATGSSAADTGAAGAVTDIGDALKAVGTLVHDTAEVLNFFFSMFRPGQMERLAALAIGAASGYGTVRLYASPSADNRLPLIFLMGGITTGCAYMAFRPWPESAGGRPIRPAPYAVDIFSGNVPAATAPPDETGAIEAGLYALLGAWLVSKAAGAASGAGGILGGLLGKLWSWAKSLGKDAEEAPVEDVPALAYTSPVSSPQGGGVELA